MKERLIPMHKLEEFGFVESHISQKYFNISNYYEENITTGKLRVIMINNRRINALVRNRTTNEIVAYVAEELRGTGSRSNPKQYVFNYYANKELLLELLLLEG